MYFGYLSQFPFFSHTLHKPRVSTETTARPGKCISHPVAHLLVRLTGFAGLWPGSNLLKCIKWFCHWFSDMAKWTKVSKFIWRPWRNSGSWITWRLSSVINFVFFFFSRSRWITCLSIHIMSGFWLQHLQIPLLVCSTCGSWHHRCMF